MENIKSLSIASAFFAAMMISGVALADTFCQKCTTSTTCVDLIVKLCVDSTTCEEIPCP